MELTHGGARYPSQFTGGGLALDQGLTLAHFRTQLEDLRDTSLTLDNNLSTFGPHPRVALVHKGDKLSLS